MRSENDEKKGRTKYETKYFNPPMNLTRDARHVDKIKCSRFFLKAFVKYPKSVTDAEEHPFFAS